MLVGFPSPIQAQSLHYALQMTLSPYSNRNWLCRHQHLFIWIEIDVVLSSRSYHLHCEVIEQQGDTRLVE